jgi:hypothetical protein
MFARENGEYGFWGGESDDDRWQLGYLKNPTIARRHKARVSRAALKEPKNRVDDSIS